MKIFSPKINLKYFAVALFFSFSSILWAQQTPTVRDSTSTTFSFRDINPPNPASVVNQYTYDPITDRYYYTSKVGDFNINYPVILTPKEFQALVQKENLKSYYKEKLDAFDGKKEGAEDAKKNLIPDL